MRFHHILNPETGRPILRQMGAKALLIRDRQGVRLSSEVVPDIVLDASPGPDGIWRVEQPA